METENIMTKTNSILSSFLLGGLLSASLFAQTSSAERYDATIQTSVTKKLDDNQKFRNVKSAVEDGIVTLTGTVDNDAQAWMRARIEEADKGGEAARAALALVRLKRRLAAG